MEQLQDELAEGSQSCSGQLDLMLMERKEDEEKSRTEIDVPHPGVAHYPGN